VSSWQLAPCGHPACVERDPAWLISSIGDPAWFYRPGFNLEVYVLFVPSMDYSYHHWMTGRFVPCCKTDKK